MSSSKNNPWWKDGIQFECQGSGKCCVSHGEYGFVYMSKEDRIRMAKSLKMTTSAFTRQYCVKDEGVYRLIDGEEGRCQFLEGKRCGVYEGRPTQCRTWPFWPEVRDAKVWHNAVESFCAGGGEGRSGSAVARGGGGSGRGRWGAG
ncbi:MAG: YkgJ family cysteine cluster protein, partial [Pseudomonadota bacterium]